MRDRAILHQAIAASSAAIMAFHGILHETIGPLLFPWAPGMFGAVLWHGLGIAVFILGLLVWCGVLGLIRFPVAPVAATIACLAFGVIVLFITTHGQFHFFALSLAVAATATAVFHRLATRGTASH